MFEFMTGLIVGAIGMFFVVGMDCLGRPSKNALESQILKVRAWEQIAKNFETECTRLHDEKRNAVHMAQYWRARCLNGHFQFKEACDGEGCHPEDIPEPTREEQLVNDIMDAVAVAGKEEKTVVCGEGEKVTTISEPYIAGKDVVPA